MTVLLQQTKIS